MSEYYIPAESGSSEYTEKKSRFLGEVRMIETEEEARNFIERVKKEHYDARHNCWCYILENGIMRYSDDGEPQGTAGQPMLNVFHKEKICNVVCVVTRYFGGILLGTGGLCRAYTKAAKDALDDAGIAVVRQWIEISLICNYNLFDKITKEIAVYNGVVLENVYAENVEIKALIPGELVNIFTEHITDKTSGSVIPRVIGEKMKAVKL